MVETDPDTKPITRGDAKAAWVVGGAVGGLLAVVLAAYFRLDYKMSRVEDRMGDVDKRVTVVETKQDGIDKTLRGIENSVSRIEGRLGVKPVDGVDPK